ncbi:MAG: hypothetical protein D6794_11830 [Deltaproteobacteria bacterium]|nr:MAG: hypothetical protein D6794_11830 [Deltaproteobacteria bacterium]
MHEKLAVLRELQDIDRELRQFEEQKRALEVRIAEKKQDMARVQEMVDALADQMEEIGAHRRRLATELDEEKAKALKSEARLPEIKTQKEYVAVLKEVDTAKAKMRELEAEMGELDSQLKGLSEEREEKETALKEAAEAVETSQAEVDAELAAFASRVDEVTTRRNELLEQLPAGVRKRYQTLISRRAGLAVVEARNGACTGCNMHLPPQLYNDLFKVDRLLDCPHCNRLLYIVEQG